ncbi:NAD(P)-binding protein [Bimuria novae-zelandiae CBS 107.79]|uniref:NAD(P)-binding protein n=1 Tax=Bimuria novae-zelandiae CBS 107.79 TaxID=1447943 RepID=A0A6A5V9N8_9PLEO|nr:NAD(P)-binding protein [Bimuria novae-zelandiae CBS 107.79]
MASRSDFGAKTDAKDVFAAFPTGVGGKVALSFLVLITGVSPKGLGAELAQSLATQKPNLLILTGRSSSKVEAVARDISTPGVEIRIILFDISSFGSISIAVQEINGFAEPSIDLVFNNAGVMNIPERRMSADGFECHLATNYLGLALFTDGILPKVKKSDAGRIVNVVSNGYAFSPFRFSDYNFDGVDDLPEDEQPSKEAMVAFGIPFGLGYIPPVAYGQSKTAAILYTRELADRLKRTNATALSVMPGVIGTELWREMPAETMKAILSSLPLKSTSQGIATMLVAALDPKLKESGGAYLNDCQAEDVQPFAKDKSKAKKLWRLTEKLTGKTFTVHSRLLQGQRFSQEILGSQGSGYSKEIFRLQMLKERYSADVPSSREDCIVESGDLYG